MINVDKKERKKENRDLVEQRKLLLERLHAQKEDAFFLCTSAWSRRCTA